MCAIHTFFRLLLSNHLTQRQRHRHHRAGRQQHPNRLPRNPQPASCRQQSHGQDYRLYLRGTRQPHQYHRPRRLHHKLWLQRPMATRNRYGYLQYDSYDSLAQVRNWTNEDGESCQQTHYFHYDQIDIPRKMTDDKGNHIDFRMLV